MFMIQNINQQTPKKCYRGQAQISITIIDASFNYNRVN